MSPQNEPPEQRGDPIPGSRYIRDFCETCREPVRVAELLPHPRCSACDAPRSLGRGNAAPATPRSERDYEGGRFNAGEW